LDESEHHDRRERRERREPDDGKSLRTCPAAVDAPRPPARPDARFDGAHATPAPDARGRSWKISYRTVPPSSTERRNPASERLWSTADLRGRHAAKVGEIADVVRDLRAGRRDEVV
jgi:hypothetical protein